MLHSPNAEADMGPLPCENGEPVMRDGVLRVRSNCGDGAGEESEGEAV
jgi:hypothetical protein